MSAKFSDYRVVSLLNKGSRGSCYCVEDRNTGRLYIWDAVDYGLLTSNGKLLLMEDVRKLLDITHQHLITCVSCVDHRVSGTLYLVKEYIGGGVSALIRKCKSTNSFVDEAFIWKIIYQVGRAVQAMYARGPPSIHLDLTPSGVNLDEEGNVKLDYWLIFRETEAEKRTNRGKESGGSRDGSEMRHKKNDTYSLGCLVHNIAALQNLAGAKNQPKVPAHYSEELQSIIELMVGPDTDKRPTIESILYHPSLLSHVVTCSLQQMTLKNPNEPTATSSGGNMGACTKCAELEAKLALVRKREASKKAKEIDLKERERCLVQKEKHVCILERLAKEKLSRAEVYLSQVKKGRSGGSTVRPEPPEDPDTSSYSADPGDTSLLPTAAKLDPSRIIRPPSLAPSISSRRSVRFETIPELEEPLRAENERMTWLQNKRNRYKASHQQRKESKVLRKDKENQEPLETASKSSVISIPHSTKETRNGVLETFFR